MVYAWLLVIAHDLHAFVVVVVDSYTLHNTHALTKSSDMLNKNSLAVKKGQGQSEANYKRPKHLISRTAKKTKLCIPNLL